jgi:TPR repeat protein
MRLGLLIALMLAGLWSGCPARAQSWLEQTDCPAIERAAMAGDAAYYVDLAVCHLRGEGREAELPKGRLWLEKAVALGDAEAMVELGNLDLFGSDGRAPDTRSAVKLYARAARLGDPNGMFNLAVIHRGGHGLPENPPQARAWYLRSGEAGSATGAFGAGVALLEGYGGRRDPRLGVLWLRRAIEMGSAEAMNELGRLHAEGAGIAPDADKALYYYRAAARNELPDAMFQLGAAHYNGRLTAKNYVVAIRWFQLAAERGDEDAWFALGLMCETGRGVRSDRELALQMYRRAAESDDAALREKAQKAIDRLLGLGEDDEDPIG